MMDIRISKLSLDGSDAAGQTYAAAVKSAFHLWNDSLDLSHELSQEIHTPTGSYLHGIMHRMEGDYSNAKYWFRQAGVHPIHQPLLQQAKARMTEGGIERIGSEALKSKLEQLSASSAWDSALFADMVSHQVTVAQDPEAEVLLLELQWTELKLLLQFAFQQTGGDSLEL